MAQNFVDSAPDMTQQVEQTAHTTIEQVAQTVGEAIAPFAENPALQTIAKLPGCDWLMVWLGQVDTAAVSQDVTQRRQNSPTSSRRAIAQQVINETALEAAQVGILTNIIPPIALALFAVDLAAITKLQAEMVYRVAAIYGMDIAEPARRGEVLGLYGLSMGASVPLKTGLSIVELIPGVGPIVGASINAKLIYLVGMSALEFYETKAQRASTEEFVQSV